jgi:hypothetical protein
MSNPSTSCETAETRGWRRGREVLRDVDHWGEGGDDVGPSRLYSLGRRRRRGCEGSCSILYSITLEIRSFQCNSEYGPSCGYRVNKSVLLLGGG